MSEVTQILAELEQKETESLEDLLPLVYNELRRIAASKMAREVEGHTLQPTALVHEAWLRLVDLPQRSWQNRAYFFAAAAEAMRRILVERARRKLAQRRGAGAVHFDVQELEIASPEPADNLLEVNEAFERFAQVEPKQAELVKLRYFAGLKIDEAAQILGISVTTANRWWSDARAWLFYELSRSPKS